MPSSTRTQPTRHAIPQSHWFGSRTYMPPPATRPTIHPELPLRSWRRFLGTTEKFVAAHRFYERNRFQQVAATKLPPNFPKMAVDSRFYRRAL